MNALEFQPPNVSVLAIKVYEKVRKKRFYFKFSDFAAHKEAFILKIFGRINLPLVERIFNNIPIKNYYYKVEASFQEAYKNYFGALTRGGGLSAAKRTFLGNRSAYGAEACLSTTTQVLRIIDEYLFYQPYPLEEAKCLRLYKIKPIPEQQTPYDYVKELKKNYLAKIEWIYALFGAGSHIVGLKLKESLDRELYEIKCFPLLMLEGSWKTQIVAWARHQDWGQKIPSLISPVKDFLSTYHFSRFLEERNFKDFHFETQEEFVVNFEDCQIPKELSFKNFIYNETPQAFFRALFMDCRSIDLSEIHTLFLKEIQKESRRTTFIYFIADAFEEYSRIYRQNKGREGYTLFKNLLNIQFKKLKHLTHTYWLNKRDKKYFLSEGKLSFYDLLLTCLLTIHAVQLCPEYLDKDRLVILRGIFKLSSEEKRELYKYFSYQVDKPYEGQPLRSSFPTLQRTTRTVLSTFGYGRRNSAPVNEPQLADSLEAIAKALRGYTFSETQLAKVKIFLSCFQKGLVTHNETINPAVSQGIDLLLRAHIIEDLKEVCGFPLPAEMVYYILNWHYLSKKEWAEIKKLKDTLTQAKSLICDMVLKKEQFFFISHSIRHLIQDVVQRITPLPSNAVAPETLASFSDCLRFALYPHVPSRDLSPFIFLALEQKGALFHALHAWAKDHCQVLRKLAPFQSGLQASGGWKVYSGKECFQISLLFFPCIEIPQSFHLEATLPIAKARLKNDPALNQILRVLTIYLCDEFEPIKMKNLEWLKEEVEWQKEEAEREQEKGKDLEGEWECMPQEFCVFENLLALFDRSIFSFLWESYQADDKKEIGRLIYHFYFQIKAGIREKMFSLLFPTSSPGEEMHEIALKGFTFANADYVSLVPLGFGFKASAYYVCKQDYQAKIEALLAKMEEKASIDFENFFEINVGNHRRVDVSYRFKIAYGCDYQQIQALEANCLDIDRQIDRQDEEEISEEISLTWMRNALSDLQSKEGISYTIQHECHEVTFSCLNREEKIEFTVIYQELPSLNLLYWQIARLKWKFYQALAQ